MFKNPLIRTHIAFLPFGLLLLQGVLQSETAVAQGSWYWNQSLNTEASLLSGTVVAGESGIAAIYYNPATISEMKRNNLSLSANLFSLTLYNANNALGTDFPADRTQLDVQPRVISLTMNPKNKPDLTIELAYFCRVNDYLQVNQGTSLAGDIIASNPGIENYTAEFYYRSRFQDYYAGLGMGYKLSNSLAVGFSALISYKDDQYYSLINAQAFTGPENSTGPSGQYLSQSMYHLKYTIFDTRLITKIGVHWKNGNWAVGTNLNLPSLKIFGDGTVVRQFEYANIHKDTINTLSYSLYYGGRQRKCTSHFKDPLSIAAGINYYTPSGNAIFLFSTEYFFGLDDYRYIEAAPDPEDKGYDHTPGDPDEWLSFTLRHQPVLNAGVAFRQRISGELWFSGGFRTDFNYSKSARDVEFYSTNSRYFYAYDVYHINYGLGHKFKNGSIILGMQFTHGRANDQRQIVNLTDPVEYISEMHMPLTGKQNKNVDIRYNDIMIYFGFVFNFLKTE
jgi:hypothetical protein